MSKAFTRELDDAPEPVLKPSPSVLPAGVKNYFTARGLEKLRHEMVELSNQPPSPQIRQRLLDAGFILQSAVLGEPPPLPWAQVHFGATVTVQNQKGKTLSYTIVGANETDLDKNRISWLSPVAKALLKKHIGEHVRFRTPAGEQNWEITGLNYEDYAQISEIDLISS